MELCYSSYYKKLFVNRNKSRLKLLKLYEKTGYASTLPSLDFLSAHMNQTSDIWYFTEMSLDPNLDLRIVEKYPNKPWNYTCLSKHPCLSLNMVERFPNKDWDFWNFHRHSHFTMDFLKKFPDKNWNMKELTVNPSFPLKFLRKDLSCSWDYLSTRRDLTYEILLEFMPYWNYNILSINFSVPFKFIEKASGFGWDWHVVSKNPQLPLEFVFKYPYDDWDIKALCENNIEYATEIIHWAKMLNISLPPFLRDSEIFNEFKYYNI